MAYLTNYIRALANQLTVIFLEDVHWADVSSLDLVNRLVREIPAARLLVVCLARPIFFERFPDWDAGAQWPAGKLDRPESYIRLDLQPLAAAESRLLVGEILQRADAVPDALRDLVVSGAEGNPFYVEETIKMLIEDGVIERDEQQWQVKVERLAAVHVPPTLTGILQARLDSLLYEERSILQRASVVGRSFWDAAVIELAADELDEAKVNMLLRALYSRELIFGQKRSAFAGITEYIFKHAMLRDVTYETVLLKLRRIYHAQVAKWLEANAGERLGEYLTLIARHYELAGENAKASEYLQRSGEELYKVNAFHDAISAFNRAMTLLPPDDTADRAVLLVRLGNAHMQLGDYDVASQHLEQGLALAHAIGDQITEVIALNGLGRIAIERGIHAEAERYLGQGLALARKNNDQSGAALALRHLGMSTYYQGQYAEAERHMREGLAVYGELKDHQGIANVLNGLGLVLLRQGMYAEAKRHFEKSLEIFRLVGDRQGAARCLNNLGDLAREHKETWKAIQCYKEALAIGREIDYRFGVAVFLFNLGYVYAEQGEERRARKHLGESLKESYALGMVDFRLSVLTGLALLHAKAGRYQLAAQVLGVLGYPNLTGEPLQTAESVLAILRQNLTAEQLAVALEHQSSDQEAIAQELLAEVQ
jgi:predicted ATPase